MRDAPEKRSNEHPKILIVGDFTFPCGMGAASRVYGYARGLLDSGARVKVLCVEPSWSTGSSLNTVARGVYRGIEFEYTGGLLPRPRTRLRRGFVRLAKWLRFAHAVHSWAAGVGGADAMIVYSRKLPWIAAARVVCWTSGAVFVHDDCEVKFRLPSDSARTWARRYAFERLSFAAYDGCIAISTHLEEYCSGRLRHGAEPLLVPVLVDVEEFRLGGGSVEIADRVTFCGGLDHQEARNVVESFALVAEEFPDIRLQLVGTAVRPGSLEGLRALADDLKVGDRVDYLGQVAREEVIDLLRAARVLVLPRPAGLFSQAGLPTKMGEYLASGRPAVVTLNGDVGLYLRDGVDAYLVPPDDSAAFGERLRHVLRHPDEADEVGRRGREAARRYFDPAVHGRRIIDYARGLQAAKALRRDRASRDHDGGNDPADGDAPVRERA